MGEKNWHSKSIDETLKILSTNPKNGISSKDVEKRKRKCGENKLQTYKEKSNIVLLLEQFNNPVIIILIIAAIFTSIVGDLKDTFVIAFVVVLNTVIGFVQERKASDALKSLRKMASPTARVIRDGQQISIPTTEVVVGDIVYLESGVRAPADARLIDSHNLMVDESMLTGESFSIHKRHDVILDEATVLGDRINMIYSGTIIQKGRGLAVVVAVGTNTELGKISENVALAEETESPLQKNIEQFGKWLSISIMAVIVLIFIIGFLRGNELLVMFLTSVGLAVSAIPEGLPVAVTITLSIGIYQMAKHKAIVKKLAAVETLGSTNVICTDKTGTLTKNQMTVTNLWIGGSYYSVSGSGYQKEGEVVDKENEEKVNINTSKTIELSAIIGALCSESTITEKNGEWEIIGDPTEGALMILANKLGFSRDVWEVSVDIPFESENQIMAVYAKNQDKEYILAKGAPEKILNRCINMINKENKHSDLDFEQVNSAILNFSQKGLRVLALAYSERNTELPLKLENLSGLTFLGFAGIEDAVRPEAIDAVHQCHQAGIRVVMITGDHIKTASAVAKTVGIAPEKEQPEAITGQELDSMNDEELFEKVPNIDVYARVAPQHKFRIVKQLQRHNSIVAMTGDGVNDAPALKQADIGVAMGSGTDVAKESAQMVLLDDNFATIVKAVRRGRVVLHNLQHILIYILSTSFGGLLTIAASVALGFPLPLLPAQLLWINLVTDGTHTFPLAFEKEHGNVMAFKPRKRDEPLINWAIIRRITFAGMVMMLGTLGVFYYYVSGFEQSIFEIPFNDPDLDKARTMAFCVLAFFQIWNAQNSRSIDRSLFFQLPHPLMYTKEHYGQKLEKVSINQNPLLIAVMIFAIFLQISAVSFDFMNILLDTTPLDFMDWVIVLGVSVSIIIFIEIFKFIHAYVDSNKAKKQLNIK